MELSRVPPTTSAERSGPKGPELMADATALDAPHATLFLPADQAAAIEGERRRWDPVMARAIAAHVTLAYPREMASIDDVRHAAQVAAMQVAPVRLRLGGVRLLDRAGPLVVQVEDLDGSFLRARQAIVAADLASLVTPHVTLVHPRTSSRAAEAWTALSEWRLDAVVQIEAVAVTAFDGQRWLTLASYDFGGAAGDMPV